MAGVSKAQMHGSKYTEGKGSLKKFLANSSKVVPKGPFDWKYRRNLGRISQRRETQRRKNGKVFERDAQDIDVSGFLQAPRAGNWTNTVGHIHARTRKLEN